MSFQPRARYSSVLQWKYRIIAVCFIIPLFLAGSTNVPGVQASSGSLASSENNIVYAWYLEDPTTAIRINWISLTDSGEKFQLRRKGARQWTDHEPDRKVSIPGSDRILSEVQLSGLRPDASYDFRIGEDGAEMSFRTLPEQLDESISFVTGGDVYKTTALMSPITSAAAFNNPRFAVIGGDWAYADGDPGKVHRWFTLFEIWQEIMVTSDGYLVPFVPAIGNHEVQGGYLQPAENAPLYFTFFDKPGKRAYYVLDIGDYLSLFLLDTNHIDRVDGAQKEWLHERLADRQDVPHVFPAYHVPAYPSNREYSNNRSRQIRENWVPLFEQYGVMLAFENHDHTFKKTRPIRSNQVDEDGIVYIGDGSWGVNTRTPDDPQNRWYMERATDDNHFWNITLFPEFRIVEAYTEKNLLLESFQQAVQGIEDGQDIPIYTNVETMGEVPSELLLAQNYPNPFNTGTVISFSIPLSSEKSRVQLDVTNVRGQRVAQLVDQSMQAGVYHITFDSARYNLSSGTYIFRLRHDGRTQSRQMQLVK